MSTEVKQRFEEEQREGALAALGFAVVLLVVGVPVWWHTTTVYRAPLPYTSIDDLSGQVNYHTSSVTIIGINAVPFADDLANHLRLRGQVRFLFTRRLPQPSEKSILASTDSIEDLDSKLSAVTPLATGTLAIYILPEDERLLASGTDIVIGHQRNIFVRHSVDVKKLAQVISTITLDPVVGFHLSKSKLAQAMKVMQSKAGLGTAVLRQVPTEPGYDITLTLMLPEPHKIRADWDVEAAVTDYLAPLVDQLKGFADLNVRSQVLYMTSLNVAPRWSSKHQHYSLPQEQLPLTINAIESKLGSFVSTRPSLHHIIYIPTEHQAPLYIHNKDNEPLATNSFLVPRWGGVIIHNVMPQEEARNDTLLPRYISLDSHWIMATVITHLHKLLPVPVAPHLDGVKVLPPQGSQLADWQLDGVARARILSYLGNIKITLQSLCELVGEIGNMVVSDEVSGWVWAAVQDWKDCGQASREGRLRDATYYCAEAFRNADAAFFHPSMLALLYFPDNQKYAIYVPLFLPVSIPVFISLRMVFRLFRSSFDSKEKQD